MIPPLQLPHPRCLALFPQIPRNRPSRQVLVPLYQILRLPSSLHCEASLLLLTLSLRVVDIGKSNLTGSQSLGIREEKKDEVFRELRSV